jgi:hypothetical protein
VPGADLSGMAGRALSWLDPVKVHATVDGAVLRTLKPTASVVFDELRRALHPEQIQSSSIQSSPIQSVA